MKATPLESAKMGYVGVLIELTTHLKADLFYLWQTTDKADDWIDHHVIGTKLKLEF